MVSITNNVSALNTLRWLNTNNSDMSSSLQKLSSGYRINTASDDPSGLVISEKLRAQNVGLKRAVQNTEEASNVIGIAEGALSEISDILSSMRELALHAANDGVTSTDQIEADQAEMDSAIEAIQTIASTTKYSGEFLLNGSQELTYDISTTVDSSLDESLLNQTLTQVNQISSSNNYAVTISFTGANAAETTADSTVSAQRAYMVASLGTNADSDYDSASGALTDDVSFVVSGSQGSESFSFVSGTTLGEVVSAIDDLSGDTGVGAALVFDSSVTTNALSAAGDSSAAHATGDTLVYSLDSNWDIDSGATATVDFTNLVGTITEGYNSDANGNLYAVWDTTTTYTLYKDAAFSMKVGEGTSGVDSTELNQSGISGIEITGTGVAAGDISVISVGDAFEFTGDSTATQTSSVTVGGLDDLVDDESVISGIRLGENTSNDGTIYIKMESDGTDVTVGLYTDNDMQNDSLVTSTTTTVASGYVSLYDQVTGLNATINLIGATLGTAGTYSGTVTFTDLGIRLYSTDYGDDQYVKLEATEGALFTDNDDNLVDAAGSDTQAVEYGQNAVVTVNGQRVELNGTSGTVSVGDLNADLVFDEGELGATTIAVQGYSVGSIMSRIGEEDNTSNYSMQALNNTSEVLDNFQGGMQLQLGEGAGNQERTVYSIEAVTTANLGVVEFTDDFNGDGKEESKALSVDDMLGGGYASLAKDPIKALKIVDQAIDDITALRARLGATQSNLLETNANSLEVAIENITSTESAIRDVDMAAETTTFTSSQILVQAATSMLAQANSMSQNVLSLLQ